MESFEAIIESEWSSLNAMYSIEESGFMARLLDYCSIPNDLHLGSNLTIPSNNTNVDHVSLGTNFFQPTSNHDSYCAGDFNHILGRNDDFVFFNEEPKENKSHENMTIQLEQEDQVPDPELHQDSVFRNPVQKSRKRSTNSVDVQKNKRNVKPKKNQKLTMTSCTNNKKQNAANQKQSSSSCSSESDSNASHEVNGVASNSKVAKTVNSNGHLRAARGTATDPQSLYARKRRERINKRLRTLQNLVPNGTKVDISTMLEDAVQYVKFLQLQIKLLSSDDMWMYAPIAYNGTDLRT